MLGFPDFWVALLHKRIEVRPGLVATYANAVALCAQVDTTIIADGYCVLSSIQNWPLPNIFVLLDTGRSEGRTICKHSGAYRIATT